MSDTIAGQHKIECDTLCLLQKLLKWALMGLASLRATLVLGWHNGAMDTLPRQHIHPGEWCQHPEVVSQM